MPSNTYRRSHTQGEPNFTQAQGVVARCRKDVIDQGGKNDGKTASRRSHLCESVVVAIRHIILHDGVHKALAVATEPFHHAICADSAQGVRCLSQVRNELGDMNTLSVTATVDGSHCDILETKTNAPQWKHGGNTELAHLFIRLMRSAPTLIDFNPLTYYKITLGSGLWKK